MPNRTRVGIVYYGFAFGN